MHSSQSNLVEQMIPTPYIEEIVSPLTISEEAHQSRLMVLNHELALHRQGIPLGDLAVGSLFIKHIENSYKIITDEQTGLLNRKGMELWYERYCPEVFGVIFADGRNFKRVNKVYGHDTGDVVIQTIGHQVASKFRIGNADKTTKQLRKDPSSRDALGIVRWGGDEFMMIVDLSSVDEEQRQVVLQKMQDRLRSFGSITDERTGDTINIEIDSAAMIGIKSDQKPLKFYRDQLDAQVSAFKASRS